MRPFATWQPLIEVVKRAEPLAFVTPKPNRRDAQDTQLTEQLKVRRAVVSFLERHGAFERLEQDREKVEVVAS
jgi:hypothetical protein